MFADNKPAGNSAVSTEECNDGINKPMVLMMDHH
jgi:hypothetical protein